MSKAQLDALMSEIPTGVSSVKALLYGEPGCGKTILAFQVAEQITNPGDRIFYIDTAQGYASLHNHPELSEVKARTTRVMFGNVDLQEELIAAIGNGDYGPVGCVIYDEFSSLVADDLTQVVAVRAKATGRGTGDEVEQRDYGTNLNRVSRLIRRAVKANVNIIFLAHSRVEGDVRKKVMPAFRESIFPTINGQVHVIGHVTADINANEKGQVVASRQVQVQPNKTTEAKSRVGTITKPIVSTDEFVAGIAKWASNNIESTTDDTFTGIEV